VVELIKELKIKKSVLKLKVDDFIIIFWSWSSERRL